LLSIIINFIDTNKMASKFRQKFDFSKIPKDIYHWFPGHMAKGLKKMYEQLPNVDAVIELHDARVSFLENKKNTKFYFRYLSSNIYHLNSTFFFT
jgi:ribosome biogenesis GTPase A